MIIIYLDTEDLKKGNIVHSRRFDVILTPCSLATNDKEIRSLTHYIQKKNLWYNIINFVNSKYTIDNKPW